MGWRALRRALDALSMTAASTWCTSTRRSSRTTPACGFARRARIPCARHLSHLLRGVPAPLPAAAAARARAAAGAQLHPLAVRGGAGPHRALRADARGARRSTASRRPSTCCPRGSRPTASAPATARPFAPAPASAPLARWSPTSAASRTRRTSASWCRCSSGCCESVPEALLVIAGEGPARESLRAQVRGTRAQRTRALRRLPRPRHRAPRLLRGRRRVRVRLAHRDAGTGAAGSDGAGHAGGLDRRARHALDPGRRAAARWWCREEQAAFAAAVVRVLQDAELRAELGARGRGYARTWSSAAMAQRLAGFTVSCVTHRRSWPERSAPRDRRGASSRSDSS